MNVDFMQLLGTEINGYIFKEVIGYGGFATIYLVNHKISRFIYAAKVIKLNKENNLGNYITYKREIESLCKLDHPNIIKLYDYFTKNDNLILILEYCKNGSLQNYIKEKGPLNEEKFLILFKEIVEALKYIHSQNIIHGDIKPLNILINKYGKAILCDFGLSIFIKNNKEFSNFNGSLGYLAPEILRKEDYNGYLADIWSLGITFYQCLTNKIPYISHSAENIYQLILTTNPFDKLDCSNDLKYLIENILTFDPLNRLNLN